MRCIKVEFYSLLSHEKGVFWAHVKPIIFDQTKGGDKLMERILYFHELIVKFKM